MRTDQLVEEVRPIVSTIAVEVRRQFQGYVDVDDLAQEMYLWVVKHPRKTEEYLTVSETDPTGREGRRKLYAAFRNTARGYAVAEKASRLKYSVGDLHWYSKDQIEQALPLLFDYESWLPSVVFDHAPKPPANPAEGNNLIAYLVDVKSALGRAEETDRELLRLRYHEGVSPDAMAKAAGVSRTVMDRKVSRALGRLVQLLGGVRPRIMGAHEGPGARHAMSNATADAVTREAWEG